ncbi:biotin/lipoyl-containing protein [Gordonia hongkongensis]|uniref:biotin/lipoyl-containing protein n=1 Tax=Gordonia hongkongensis TaxID=1701090 RepID=UPI003D7478BE
MRNVLCILNGQLRPVRVRDRSVESTTRTAEKADPALPRQLAAPFAGVVTLSVKEGDELRRGEPIGTIEAMKMEASISAPVTGIVQRIAVSGSTEVDGGDLLLTIATD